MWENLQWHDYQSKFHENRETENTYRDMILR
jgi:hypothetical protein